MLKIITRNRSLLKHYKFSTYANGAKYPYVFGGLKLIDHVFNNKEEARRKSVVGQIWGQSIFQHFVQAYNAYLEGLRDNDKQFLQQILAKQLTKGIQFVKTKLSNPDSQITVSVGNETIVIGGTFDRDLHQHEWKSYYSYADQNNSTFKLYAASLTSTTPVLYSVQVYFKSKKKLVKESETNIVDGKNRQNSGSSENKAQQSQKQQIHMLQMEFENKRYQIFSIYPLFAKEWFKCLFDKSRSLEIQILKKILNVDGAQWRVADADKVLGGNFPKLQP